MKIMIIFYVLALVLKFPVSIIVNPGKRITGVFRKKRRIILSQHLFLLYGNAFAQNVELRVEYIDSKARNIVLLATMS